MCNVVRHKCSMDEDRERGRIAANATKRRQAVDYARSVLPIVREAVGANRRLDGTINLNGMARWLNDHGTTSQRGGAFVAETVSRLLYKTEESVRHFATYERDKSVAILEYKGRAKASDIATLDAARDQAIAEGVALGRLLRCEDIAPVGKMVLEDAARLIIHQLDHRKRCKSWDETKDYPVDGLEKWLVKLLGDGLATP
jgi:hypothetical protein